MTLAESRLHLERRYWQDLLTRLPSVRAAARVADVDYSTMYLVLKRCGLSRHAITPPNPPLDRHEIGLKRRAFMLRGEHDYWMRMLAQHRDGTLVATAAGVERSSIYKRFKACGLSPRFIRKMLGRKLYYGNEAWQRLTAESRTHI